MRSIFIIGLLLIALVSQGQWVFQRLDAPVVNGAKTLINAWAGGFNNPQFSEADLNNDGITDLVVLERGFFEAGLGHSGSRILTFLNAGTPGEIAYTYAPQYEAAFPPLYQWMLMKDYNCDGVADIFTTSPGQVDLYLGSFVNGNLRFDYRGFLPYNTFTGPLNIYVSSLDIPAIEDINNDGDLDIVTFQQFGVTIDYFENLSQELTNTCGDTLLFEYRDFCWGKVWELGLNKTILLDTCSITPKNGGPRHTGSTLLAFDEDNDGDKELVLGDVTFDNLTRLVNGGTPDTAHMIAQDTAYPSYDLPANMHIFPAPFMLDVNNDGKRDLLVSPNITRASVNTNCAWFYSNVSTNDTVRWQFQNDSFLVDGMIDLGEGAYPAFFDYDGDGLKDLVVGNYGYYSSPGNYKSGLALFKNTGSGSFPAFKLVTRDYVGLFNQLIDGKPMLNIAPSFGDLDNDGDDDLLVGDSSGKLRYFDNQAIGASAAFILTNPNYFNIDVGTNSTPFLHDLNGDGLLDIIVGNKSGSVAYFENRGTAANAVFNAVADNAALGEIDTRYPQFINGYSTPIVTHLDSSNHLFLLSGNEEGRILAYLIDPSKLKGGRFRKVFDFYSGIDGGERTALSITDLDNDGKMEMLVGNYRGGLGLYRQIDSLQAWLPDTTTQVVEIQPLDIHLAPNPTNSITYLYFDQPFKGTISISIFNITGSLLESATFDTGINRLPMDVSHLNPGIYLLSIANGSTHKILKLLVY
ncbi:MAG: T9SS type A sorting domain-containing protein [Chitinophagales bacterium]|nr:T9SS type A sorting domain-containing protein [Chitinophagales bacterium]